MRSYRLRHEPIEEGMKDDLERILKIEVPIIVRLGKRKVTVSEVLSLCPGAIIELDKTAEEELDLLVNNQQIASGIAVKIAENFALRISYIGDIRQRIEALGDTAEKVEAGSGESRQAA